MRLTPDSHAGRILALLEQGGWWSCSELMREVPAIVHSRMDNVRKHLRDEGLGRSIEHKTTGVGAQHSLYRLALPTTGAPSATGDGDDGGSSAPVAGNARMGVPKDTPVLPSPREGSVSPSLAGPSHQLALDLPGRLHRDAA